MNRLPRPLRAAVALSILGAATGASAACPDYLNHEFQKLHSKERVNLCEASGGRPMLIVNTASHCGFTPQFTALEVLYEKYRDRGLVVVGFPSDDFHQEAASESETAQVCYVNYGVKFLMLAPGPVRGDDANVVFRELARQSGGPKWNFNKYLVRPDGTVVRHFGSFDTPDSADVTKAIESTLAQAVPPAR